jgi:gamma-glutamylcyclotransferase (GGCT)/AIG2-like uncharacterized protein YtfP
MSLSAVRIEGYPGMAEEGVSTVSGEVYRVDIETLLRIDQLERHPEWYVRRTIQLANGVHVQTYILPILFCVGATVIESGDWTLRQKR